MKRRSPAVTQKSGEWNWQIGALFLDEVGDIPTETNQSCCAHYKAV
jgi:transcriptional regulator with GAF, ATPase, and Fis domain